MNFFELIFIGLGLSMDAFAVAVCKGLETKKLNEKIINNEAYKKQTIKLIISVGIYFGFFQGLMPFLGYFIGFGFKEKIVAVSHLIAFILLVFLGFKMIKDSFKIESYPSSEKNINFKFLQMIGLAIATSIDAMAVGISFAFLNVKIVPAAILIGVLTFFISMIGVKIGIKFGGKFKSKAEIAGGVILILIGIKIFLEHIFK